MHKQPSSSEVAHCSEREYESALAGQVSSSGGAQNSIGGANSTTPARTNSDECYRCHQLGHWAKDCPSPNVPTQQNIPQKTCRCGRGPCLVLNSTTDKNPGRKFYRCPLGKENGGCTYFEWCDAIALRGSMSQLWQASSPGGAQNPTGSATSTTLVKTNADECYRCHQLGHWAKDCPSPNVLTQQNIPQKTCRCGGGPCLVLTSTTDKNPGRKFYRCPLRNENGGCKYFEWCDAIALRGSMSQLSQASSSRGAPNPTGSPTSTTPAGTNADECYKCHQLGHWAKNCPSPNAQTPPNIPQKTCRCGRGPCLVLTSTTDKNPGRKFYSCPLGKENGECKYFEWCDAIASSSSGRQGAVTFRNYNGVSQVYDFSILCPCGAGPCPVLTATDGNDLGRKYVQCPVKKGEGSCSFFKWYED